MAIASGLDVAKIDANDDELVVDIGARELGLPIRTKVLTVRFKRECSVSRHTPRHRGLTVRQAKGLLGGTC